LESLGCLDKDDKNHLNVGGLLLFGSAKALRRAMPTVRVDYIRVQGVARWRSEGREVAGFAHVAGRAHLVEPKADGRDKRGLSRAARSVIAASPVRRAR